jgi:hypothetical protein
MYEHEQCFKIFYDVVHKMKDRKGQVELMIESGSRRLLRNDLQGYNPIY